MKFLNRIKKANSEELNKIVCEKIRLLEKKSKKDNPNIRCIGRNIGFNYQKYSTIDHGDYIEYDAIDVIFFNQFICQDMKIVYGNSFDKNGNAGNLGKYYYADDQSYLYDFCRFIKSMDIDSDTEFMGYVLDYLNEYFGKIKFIDRDILHQPIMKLDGTYFEPIRKHSISDFKGNGSAMCSEYSVMAHNILRLFDMESYLVFGYCKFGDDVAENHAYNIVTYFDELGERKSAIVDFKNPIAVLDYNLKVTALEPFIGEIPKLNQKDVDEFVFGDKHYTFDGYAYSILGQTVLKLGFNRTRDYFANQFLYINSVKPKQKSLKKPNSVS